MGSKLTNSVILQCNTKATEFDSIKCHCSKMSSSMPCMGYYITTGDSSMQNNKRFAFR